MSPSRFPRVLVVPFALGLTFLVFGVSPNPYLQAQPQSQSATPQTPAGLSVLYNFDGKCSPASAATHCDPLVWDGGGLRVGAMVQGPPGDDNFYGATPGGGAHTWGTIFRVTLTKDASGNNAGAQVTVLYNFGDAGAKDARSPSGGLTLGNDGNLYGTTYAGGDKNFGTVFRMARGFGKPEILYSFRNGVPDPPQKGQPPPPPLTQEQIDDLAASFPVSPPVLARDGNLYGVTPSSNPGGGVLYQLPPGGVLKCIHRYKPQEAATYGLYPATLAQGSDGSLYGTTWGDDHGRWETVFRFNPSSAAAGVDPIYKLRPATDGGIPNGVIQAKDGNLYGTTYSGGPGFRGVVFRLTLAGQYTVLHAFGGNQANPVSGVVEVLRSDPVLSGSSTPQTKSYYLYGASPLNGILYRLREDGDGKDFSVVYTFDGVTGAGPTVTPVLSASDSNLYGIAAYGGKFAAGVFYRLNIAPLPAREGCVEPTSASGSGSMPASMPASSSLTVSGSLPIVMLAAAAQLTPTAGDAAASTTPTANSSLQTILSQAFAAQSSPGKSPTATSAQPTQCPKMITFTSYSGAITSEQLKEAYLSIYDRSDKFKLLMDNVIKQHLVHVVVVANDPQHPDREYARLARAGVVAYQNFLNHHPSDPSGKSEAEFKRPPSNDNFAYTTRPDSNGVIDVVISEQALEYGWYPGFSRDPTYPKPDEHFLPQNIVPQIAPIQLPLAYELGSNVAALATDPCYSENPQEADTNEILKQAFPLSQTPPYNGYVPNESIVAPSGTNPSSASIPTADRELSGAMYYLPSYHPAASVQGTGLRFDNSPKPPNPVKTYYSTDGQPHTGISLQSIGFPPGKNCP